MLEGNFKGQLVQPPCSETFKQSRLFRNPSMLTQNVGRDGASNTFLGTLGQCFTTLHVKRSSFSLSLNLPLPVKNPKSPTVLSQETPLKSLSLAFFSAPLSTEQPQRGLPGASSKMYNSNSPSLRSEQRGTSPQITSVAYSEPAPTSLCLSCTEEFWAGQSSAGGVSSEESTLENDVYSRHRLSCLFPPGWALTTTFTKQERKTLGFRGQPHRESST